MEGLDRLSLAADPECLGPGEGTAAALLGRDLSEALLVAAEVGDRLYLGNLAGLRLSSTLKQLL